VQSKQETTGAGRASMVGVAVALVGCMIVAAALAASQSEPAEAEKRGEAELRGTEQSPVVVKILPTPDAEKEAGDQKREREEKAQLDRKVVALTDELAKYTGDLAFFTKLLVCIGVAQLVVFGYQSWQLKRTVDTAVLEGAPALFPCVTNMERLHGEWSEGGGTLTFEGERQLRSEILFAFQNHGKTPAIIRRVQADLFITANDALPVVDWEKLPLHHHEEVMAAKTTRADLNEISNVDLAKNFSVSAGELNELFAEAKGRFRRIFLVGFVVYDDLYGMRHTTRFCRKLRKAPNVRFQSQHGALAYNNTTRKKIPRPDPFDRA
jgi:hypothetical protein